MDFDLAYLTPKKKVEARFTVQGSKFIATLAPVESEAAGLEFLNTISAEFPDATHHTYAYRIGTGSALIERSSDDGEPAGTAGAPMLQVLQGRKVSDVLVVGTRYFGGAKLGIGGLTRAYRACARLSLEKVVLKSKEPLDSFQLRLGYEDLGAVTRLLESLEGETLKAAYSEKVILEVSIPARSSESLARGFESACRGRGSFKKL